MVRCFLLHKFYHCKVLWNDLRICFSHLYYLLTHFLIFSHVTCAWRMHFANLRFKLSKVFIKHVHEIQNFTMHSIDLSFCSRPTRWRGDRSFLLIWCSCCSSALHTWIIFLSFLSICSSKILVLSRKNHLLFIQLIIYFLIWSWFFFTCIRKTSSPKANELEDKSNKIITSHTAFRKQWFSFLMNLLKRIRLLCNSSDFYQYRMWS